MRSEPVWRVKSSDVQLASDLSSVPRSCSLSSVFNSLFPPMFPCQFLALLTALTLAYLHRASKCPSVSLPSYTWMITGLWMNRLTPFGFGCLKYSRLHSTSTLQLFSGHSFVNGYIFNSNYYLTWESSLETLIHNIKSSSEVCVTYVKIPACRLGSSGLDVDG